MNLRVAIELLGRPVDIVAPDGTHGEPFLACIQPLRYKNKMYLDGVNTEIGFNSQGHYFYVGPPSPDLSGLTEGEYLCSDGVLYKVVRAEKVYFRNRPAFTWAIIRTVVD
jgi:hypothetical protein